MVHTPREDDLGFPILVLGVFLMVMSSITNQVMISYWHIHFPIIAITQGAAFLAFLAAGKHLEFLKAPVSKPYLLLAAWWVITSVTGDWPAGSLGFLGPYLWRIYTIPFLIVALAATPGRVRVLMNFIAAGSLMIVGYCVLYGSNSNNDGRFIIPETTLRNPNDLALALLLGAAFLMVFLANPLARILTVGALPLLALYVLRTGSRGNLLGLCLAAVVSVFILPPLYRKRMIGAMVVMIVLVVPFVPANTWNRLFTFSVVDRDSDTTAMELKTAGSAVASTKARIELQKRAMVVSLSNPVFGVGPKNFTIAVDKMIREETGRKSSWEVSHNAYLQVSAESGIPGLIIYLTCIVMMFRMNLSAFRETQKYPFLHEYMLHSYVLVVATTIYSVDLLFTSLAYDGTLPLFLGLTVANSIGLSKLIPKSAPAAMRGMQVGGPAPGRQPFVPQQRMPSFPR